VTALAAFVAGLFVGGPVGLLLAALCVAASRGDRQSPHHPES
jgi:hypothetical protein